MTSKDLGLSAVLVLTALLVRIAWHGIAVNRDWPDTASYLSAGETLFRTGLMDSTVYMPLYPILLVVFGYSGIVWLQLMISALTVGLVHRLSLELFAARPAALASGLIACFYPLLIFYANMRLSETAYIFLTLLAFWAFYRGSFTIGSAILVLSILVRPVVDLLAPLLLVAFCVARGEGSLRLIVQRLAVYAVVYVVLMAPWWWHNWLLYGTFVRLNLSSSTLLILENNPLFDQVGLNFQALAPAWEKFNSIADPLGRAAAMQAEALAYIRSHPAHWIWRCFDRFLRFWSPTPQSESILVNTIAVLTTLPVMIAAGLSVMRFKRRDYLRFGPILLLILYFTLVHSVLHGIARYRLPLDAFLIILAGGSLTAAATMFRSRRGAGLVRAPDPGGRPLGLSTGPTGEPHSARVADNTDL